MDIAERLKNIQYITPRTMILLSDIAQMETQIENLQSEAYGNSETVKEFIKQLTDTINNKKNELLELQNEQEAIIKAIEKLQKPIYQIVLLNMHFKGKSYSNLVLELNIAYTTLARYHSKAMKELEKYLL